MKNPFGHRDLFRLGLAGLTVLLVSGMVTACVKQARTAETDDHSWQEQVVAACLIHEAAGQGKRGMEAVASVIFNRAKGQPSHLYEVVTEPYAFSSFNQATAGQTGETGFADLVTEASRDRNWYLALQIVNRLFAGNFQDITHGATHYARKDTYADWMQDMVVTTTIGQHRFYRRTGT